MQLQRFDVVLMDLQMPELDGFEATARIRQLERHEGRRTPIIALTAHAMKSDEDRCLAAGMDGYLCKPISPDELLAAINHFASTVTQPTPHERTEAQAVSTRLDRDSLLARVGGNVELLREILEISPGELSRLHRDLERAVGARDARKVAVVAHTLKGALGNLNAASAANAARQIGRAHV